MDKSVMENYPSKDGYEVFTNWYNQLMKNTFPNVHQSVIDNSLVYVFDYFNMLGIISDVNKTGEMSEAELHVLSSIVETMINKTKSAVTNTKATQEADVMRAIQFKDEVYDRLKNQYDVFLSTRLYEIYLNIRSLAVRSGRVHIYNQQRLSEDEYNKLKAFFDDIFPDKNAESRKD